jgi:AbiV family abortive infection protein
MPRKLPNLSPDQVIAVQDALLANADRLLTSALTVLELGNIGLARSLAILGMEESGKAIAIHDRRVQMAYAPEGEPFVTDHLSDLWASHQRKLELVYGFLVHERYWFGTGPSDPEENRAYLGTIKRWTYRHNNLKKRGLYVELDKAGNALSPAGVSDEESLADVISHVHRIGWQLRLGEHIEAKSQAEKERGMPPASAEDVEHMRRSLVRMDNSDFVEHMLESMRLGVQGETLNNHAYRIKLPEPGSNPFATLGKPGYEAETRELLMLAERIGLEADELDEDSDAEGTSAGPP